jgi:hypothetical protein
MITGMPSGLSLARFDAFGIYTRLTATGAQDDADRCAPPLARALEVSATSPSIPRSCAQRLRCVTCRTLVSVLDRLRDNTGRPAARCLP